VITQCSPKSEHHPTRLEEAHFGVRLLRATPAQRLVEAASAGQITHAESYEADALFQVESIPRRLPRKRRLRTPGSECPLPPDRARRHPEASDRRRSQVEAHDHSKIGI
jgi:hypothetical protein